MKNINLNLSRKNFQPVLSLYFFTLSASLLGFSIYLFLEAVSIVPSKSQHGVVKGCCGR